jgi:hypothetical protein
MGLTGRIRARLDALQRSERGFAVATVLAVIVIGLSFSAVAVSVAVQTQGQTSRDLNKKVALAIADAGAQQALFNYNKITTVEATPCIVKDTTTDPTNPELKPGDSRGPSTGTFCGGIGGPNDPDARVGTGYFTYYVDPCLNEAVGGACHWLATDPLQEESPRNIEIVSVGCSNMSPTCAGGIQRRVSVSATGNPGSLATGNAKAIGLDAFTMSGWSELEVPAATNGSFKMLQEGGCPNAGSDRDGYLDGDPLNNANGCPRVCPGDWQYNAVLSIGPSPPNDVETPANTQACSFDKDLRPYPVGPGCNVTGRDPYHVGLGCPRVNPPGPAESSVCSETFNAQDAASRGGDQCKQPDHRTITLAPVDIGTYKTQNDNGRLGNCRITWTNQAAYNAAVQAGQPPPSPIYARSPASCGTNPNADTVDGPGTVNWDPVSRTLTLDGTGDTGHRLSLNIGGSNYVLCRLVMTGESRLYMTNTTKLPGTDHVATRFFFDSPENCGLPNGSDQISLRGDSNFESQTWNPFAKSDDPNQPPDIGLLPLMMMVGSTRLATNASIHTNNFFYPLKVMLYAPRTDIVLDTGFARENEGWFAGKTIAMQHGSEIESPPALGSVGVGIAGQDYTNFQQYRYVECGPPGTTIDANC